MVSPAELVEAAVRLGLDLIAITDHDTMALAGEVAERGAAAGLAVVKGMEVTTAWPAQTHLLGWFLERPVSSGRPLEETVRAIHDQGGLAVLPHPFMPTYFASCQPGRLARLIEAEVLDAVEVLHTAPTTASRRRRLEAFHRAHSDRLGARVGGSDCHFGGHDLGLALTRFPGRTAEDFRRAVLECTTEPVRSGRARAVPPALVARQQLRSLVELPLRRLTGRVG
jgi:hypothetical protein